MMDFFLEENTHDGFNRGKNIIQKTIKWSNKELIINNYIIGNVNVSSSVFLKQMKIIL